MFVEVGHLRGNDYGQQKAGEKALFLLLSSAWLDANATGETKGESKRYYAIRYT